MEVVLERGTGILLMGHTAGRTDEVIGRDVTNLAGADVKERKK